MFQSFRPTLETLERREVFSTTADLVPVVQAASDGVPTEQLSFNFASVAGVTTGDFNGDGTLDLASTSFAGDGIGIDFLLPYLEQDNIYKFQGGCNVAGDAFLDAVYRDVADRGLFAPLLPYVEQENPYKQLSLSVEPEAVDSALAAGDAPWADLDRQQIIAILIGLMRGSDAAGQTQRLTDVTDGTSNTLAITHDADFEKWAGAFESATPERQSQIIAILIGLLQNQA